MDLEFFFFGLLVNEIVIFFVQLSMWRANGIVRVLDHLVA